MARMTYKTALITGGSSGIGRQMALWWAKRGTKVYATARRMTMLEELAKEGGGNIIPVTMDVTKEDEAVAAIQKLDDDCGGLDLVIANAGVGDPTPAHLSSWPMVQQVLRVNIMGAAATITAVLPRMIERGRGHVVGVSSLAGVRGIGAYSAYSSSKAFLSTFLDCIRIDVHGTPVKVTCIEPGFVRSEMLSKVEGKAPMFFVADTHVAADVFCKAIARGARRIQYPRSHAATVAMLDLIPGFVFDPVAKRVSKPQVAIAEEALRRIKG